MLDPGSGNRRERRHFIKTLGTSFLGVQSGSLTAGADEVFRGRGIELCFTGTGAADWPQDYPSPDDTFSRGGFRGNAGLILDSTILLDCGRTVPGSILYHGMDVNTVNDVFITHSHGDHLNGDALRDFLALRKSGGTVRLWGHGAALERAGQADGYEKRPLDSMQSVTAAGFTVTALPANHVVGGSNEQPLHYLFEKDGKRILYTADGAWFLKEVWLYLRERQLDGIIWDATIGTVEGDWRIFEHNSLAMIGLMIETFREQEVLKPGAQNILTHMARTLWPSHGETEVLLEDVKCFAAWDGLTLTL